MNNSRLPRFFRRNLITSYGRTVSTAVIALVMTPVLVHGLGTEAFGVWALVTSLALYRDLLQFGLASATPKYVAEYTAKGEHEKVRAAVATSFWLLTIPGALALIIGVALAATFPDLFNVPSDIDEQAQICVLSMMIATAIAIPTDSFSGALMGLQRYDLLNAVLVVVAVAQAIGWAVVLLAGGGLAAIGIVTAALSLVGQLAQFLVARRLIPGLTISPRQVHRHLIKPFAGFSIWIGIEETSFVAITRTDTIVVGAVLGVGAAGIYGVGQKIALAIAQLVQPISSLFFPHASQLASEHDSDALRRSLLAGTRLSAAVALPLSLTAAVLAGPILDAWVGSGFSQAIPVVVFLAAGITITALSDTGLVMLQGIGKPRGPAIIRLLEAVVNLGLSILLANLIGLKGVALGTLIAVGLLNLLILFPYMCREFEVPLGRLVGTLLATLGPPSAAALLVGWLLRQTDPSGIPAVIGAGALMMLAYAAVFAFTGMDAEQRRTVAARFSRVRPGSYPPPA